MFVVFDTSLYKGVLFGGATKKRGTEIFWGKKDGCDLRIPTQKSFVRRFDIWILMMLVSRVLIEVPTSRRIPDINFINLGNNNTSKCMHGMNQTETEYSRHGKGPKEQV